MLEAKNEILTLYNYRGFQSRLQRSRNRFPRTKADGVKGYFLNRHCPDYLQFDGYHRGPLKGDPSETRWAKPLIIRAFRRLWGAYRMSGFDAIDSSLQRHRKMPIHDIYGPVGSVY